MFYWKKLPDKLFDPESDLRSRPRPIIETFDDISFDESSDYYEKKVNSLSNLIKISKKSEMSDKGLDISLIRLGKAQASDADKIILYKNPSGTDDEYNGMTINIVDGTGSGQIRQITDYDGTTKVATVDQDWNPKPDTTSVYSIVVRARAYIYLY